jgi:hypothetical protein
VEASERPGAPPASEPSLLEREPGVVSLYAFDNITLIVWHAQPNERAVDRLHRVTERRRKQYPNGISTIHLVKVDISLPDQPTRDAFVRLMKSSNGALACVAVVVGGAGFWASTARSMITGMRVLARGQFDMRLHGEISEVVKWLPERHAARTGVHVDAVQLGRALHAIDLSP